MSDPSVADFPNTRVPGTGSGLVYVLPHYDASSSEHYAHVPHLLRELSRHLVVGVVVERGEVPPELAHLPFVRVLAPPGTSTARRTVRMFRAIIAARRAGFRTWFLRYSRPFLMALALTRPFLSHRVLYWSSGQADLAEPTPLPARWRRKIDEAFRYTCLHLADRVVTGPETMHAYLQQRWRLPPERVRLLYNDIDTRRFTVGSAAQRASARVALGWTSTAFVVLFVHRIAYRRGSRLLVPLAERLHADLGQDFHLAVIGDGPDLPLLRRQLARSAACSSVSLLGALPNAALPQYFTAADCFLQPSYEEGMPRVLLEAMASGLPVVSTAAGGTRDMLGSDYPYVVPVGDVTALGDALLALARDPQARRHLGATLRRRAQERFDTSVVIPSLVELVRDSS